MSLRKLLCLTSMQIVNKTKDNKSFPSQAIKGTVQRANMQSGTGQLREEQTNNNNNNNTLNKKTIITPETFIFQKMGGSL